MTRARRLRLIEGDCLARMRQLRAGSVDAIVTDPPYCSGAVSEAQRASAAGHGLRSSTVAKLGWFVGDNMGTAGLAWLLRAVAFEATRVVKPAGSMLVFCDWRMQASLQPAIESAGLRYQGLIVWDKGQLGLGHGFRCQHELILHFTFGAPEFHDRSVPNVIRCPRVARSRRAHQTEKPVGLLEPLVRVVAPPGGLVLDPFAGSAATGEACRNAGRRFLGFERDPAHVAAGRRRLAIA